MKPWPTEARSEDRFTAPSDWCPNPGRWHSTDGDSTEEEVSELVAAFATALRPDIIVETGTAWGATTEQIGLSLWAGGYGAVLHSFEVDPERVLASRERCEIYCRSGHVQIHNQSSLEGIAALAEEHGGGPFVGLAFLDSLFDLRGPELDALAPHLLPGAIVLVHDAGPHHPLMGMLSGGGHLRPFSALRIRNPRGLLILQKEVDL